MTQWVVEEALLARVDATERLGDLLALERRQIEHDTDRVRREAHAALQGL